MKLPSQRALVNIFLVITLANAVSIFLIGGALLLHLFTRMHP